MIPLFACRTDGAHKEASPSFLWALSDSQRWATVIKVKTCNWKYYELLCCFFSYLWRWREREKTTRQIIFIDLKLSQLHCLNISGGFFRNHFSVWGCFFCHRGTRAPGCSQRGFREVCWCSPQHWEIRYSTAKDNQTCELEIQDWLNVNPTALLCSVVWISCLISYLVVQMLHDLNTYLHKAIPDTKLTIRKYLDVKFEYLVSEQLPVPF